MRKGSRSLPPPPDNGYEPPVTRHPRMGREIAAFGGPRRFRGRDVLDIGTGAGRLAFDVAPYARSVVGIDISGEHIGAARAAARENGLRNVSFAVGDATDLRLPRARFDVVILSWSL